MFRSGTARALVLGITVAAMLLIAACGGSSSPSAAASSVAASIPSTASDEPSGSAAEAPAAAPTSVPSASQAPEAPAVALGTVGVTPRGSRVTVHSFGQSNRSSPPPAGSAWQEADLEWCLPSTLASAVTAGNIRYELKLELSDGTMIEPEAHADSSNEVYALDGTFRADECVRGAMVFAVPTAAAPNHLVLVGPKGGMRWQLS